MKALAAIFISISFFAIAVLGFIAIGAEGEHSGCIAETAFGAVCPDNTLAFIDFHLGALKSFSTGIVAVGLAAALLAFFLIFGMVFPDTPAGINIGNFACAALTHETPSSKSDIRYWLSLRENSPNRF